MTTPMVKTPEEPSDTPDFSLLVGEQARRLFASLTPTQLEMLQSALRPAGSAAQDTSLAGTAVVSPLVMSPQPTAAVSQQPTAVVNPQSIAVMNPQSAPPRTPSTFFHVFPALGVRESQQKRKKRAAGKSMIAGTVPPPLDEKPARPLNSWLAFRSYYRKIFVRSQQKDISTILTCLWQADPFKAKWALLAKAYSLIRDAVGKHNAPLEDFIQLVVTFIGIIPYPEYLAALGWEISVDDGTGQNSFLRSFVPDEATFDEGFRTTSHSVSDIIQHVSESGYIPQGRIRIELNGMLTKISHDTHNFASGGPAALNSLEPGSSRSRCPATQPDVRVVAQTAVHYSLHGNMDTDEHPIIQAATAQHPVVDMGITQPSDVKPTAAYLSPSLQPDTAESVNVHDVDAQATSAEGDLHPFYGQTIGDIYSDELLYAEMVDQFLGQGGVAARGIDPATELATETTIEELYQTFTPSNTSADMTDLLPEWCQNMTPPEGHDLKYIESPPDVGQLSTNPSETDLESTLWGSPLANPMDFFDATTW